MIFPIGIMPSTGRSVMKNHILKKVACLYVWRSRTMIISAEIISKDERMNEMLGYFAGGTQ
jgi:hypothetical protein